jgi:AhpD family alkylhydroperoxidase
MSHLTPRERELVSLGAAMGSNSVSCIQYHIPASRKAGLSETQISEAIRLADQVRQVPAGRTLDVAVKLLAETIAPAQTEAARESKPCCG